MYYGQRLRTMRCALGLKQEELAALLMRRNINVTGKTISSWERGETEPKVRQAIALCDALNADVYDIFGTASINAKGLGLLSELRALIGESEKYREATRLVSLPVYDMPASAGLGAFVDSDTFCQAQVNAELAAKADFGVRVTGDSMEPRFSSGDIAWVKRQQTVSIGDIGVFYLDGLCYIKRLGAGELISLNKKYPPIPLSEYSQLHVFGVVAL